MNGLLYALNRRDGSKRWTFKMPHEPLSSAVIGANGLVYAQNWGTLYAINTKTGLKAWQYQVPDDLYSKSTPAIGSGGKLYATFVLKGETRDNRARVVALDVASGDLLWQRDLPYYIYSSPAVGANGYVYVGCGDGKLYALDEKSGRIEWSLDFGPFG